MNRSKRTMLSSVALIMNPAVGLNPPSKGKPNRRIIAKTVANGREWYLHATKGWRSYALR